MRHYLAIIGPDKDQPPTLALNWSHTGPKLVTIGRLLTIIWSPLHQLLPVTGVQAHGHVASQPRLQLCIYTVINRGLEGYKIGRFSITMHHDVYLGSIDRWQQHGLQQRLNTRYNAVSGLSQRCFKTLIRGTEQIGSQPLRNMLEARYKTLLRRLLLRCYMRCYIQPVSFCCHPI